MIYENFLERNLTFYWYNFLLRILSYHIYVTLNKKISFELTKQILQEQFNDFCLDPVLCRGRLFNHICGKNHDKYLFLNILMTVKFSSATTKFYYFYINVWQFQSFYHRAIVGFHKNHQTKSNNIEYSRSLQNILFKHPFLERTSMLPPPCYPIHFHMLLIFYYTKFASNTYFESFEDRKNFSNGLHKTLLRRRIS